MASEETQDKYSRRVLCVDDDAPTLTMRKILLETSGYSVLTANSGREALELLQDGRDVDLVVLDYLMPGMNGDELAAKLREQYPDLPLVVVSAVGQLPAALLDLVDSHAQKGQDPEVLLSILSAVLGRSRRKAELAERTSDKVVLCVDDEPLQLKLRKTIFESDGFQVLEAQTPGEAMKLFASQPVDAVVMDYWLSGANGTTLAQEMKRVRPRTPIIMLSGFSSLPGEGVIVDAWLRKTDIEPDELVNEVKRLIRLRAEGSQAPQ